jgi:hypothetical protein
VRRRTAATITASGGKHSGIAHSINSRPKRVAPLNSILESARWAKCSAFRSLLLGRDLDRVAFGQAQMASAIIRRSDFASPKEHRSPGMCLSAPHRAAGLPNANLASRTVTSLHEPSFGRFYRQAFVMGSRRFSFQNSRMVQVDVLDGARGRLQRRAHLFKAQLQRLRLAAGDQSHNCRNLDRDLLVEYVDRLRSRAPKAYSGLAGPA